MKQYDTGMNTALTAAIVVAVIVVGGVIAATIYFPGIIPTTTTMPTTTPTTTDPAGGFGIRAASYLESRRDDVAFYCILNCSLVNVDISSFYSATQPGAFVDIVKLFKTETGGDIEVGFSPYDANILGEGEITAAEWETLSGQFVNSIEMMPDANNPPESFPSTWPIELYMGIYFDDNTFFRIGFTESDQMVNLVNGTWTGSFNEMGWPEIANYNSQEYWLNANGLLEQPMGTLYSLITNNAAYPAG